jgi:hypothetical protein
MTTLVTPAGTVHVWSAPVYVNVEYWPECSKTTQPSPPTVAPDVAAGWPPTPTPTGHVDACDTTASTPVSSNDDATGTNITTATGTPRRNASALLRRCRAPSIIDKKSTEREKEKFSVFLKAIYSVLVIALRQVALVARDLDAAIADVKRHLDVDVCFRDPGVAEFGLHNALFRIGNQFLEIVSPVTDGTTAGRLLEKMGGDCGYMAIFEVDDLDARMTHLSSLGVRTVWQGDFRQIRGRHLHPKDTGGTLVSIDQPHQPGEWHWAGPNWRDRKPSGVATGLVAITLSSPDPDRLRRRWSELDFDVHVNYLKNGHAENLRGVTARATRAADRGRTFTICGVEFTLS